MLIGGASPTWGSTLEKYPGEVASPTWGLVSLDLGVGFPDLGKDLGEVLIIFDLRLKWALYGSGFPPPGDRFPPTWGSTLGKLRPRPGEVPWGKYPGGSTLGEVPWGSCIPTLGKFVSFKIRGSFWGCHLCGLFQFPSKQILPISMEGYNGEITQTNRTYIEYISIRDKPKKNKITYDTPMKKKRNEPDYPQCDVIITILKKKEKEQY